MVNVFTVLFTAAGRRVELIQAFRDSFSQHGLKAKIIGADLNPDFAPACYFTDASFKVPPCTAPEYPRALLEICRKEQVNLLIPLYEPEFLVLDGCRQQFEQLGTKVLLSDKKVIEICKDKYRTYGFLKQHNIKTPETWIANNLPETVELPLFAKPRLGMGSVGVQKINSQAQLAYISRAAEYILQKFISGTEYTLDILSDLSGKVLSVVPRERLEVRTGEVSKSRTVKRMDLLEQGKAIAEMLGAIGPVNLQCIDDGTDVYWIEVNPRFGGGFPLSFQAGVDYPYLLYRMYTGQPVKPMIGEFRDNLTMLRYDQAIYYDGR